jgi:hypothetical protein
LSGAREFEFERLNRAVISAKLKVPISERFPLAKAAKTHEHLAAGHVRGQDNIAGRTIMIAARPADINPPPRVMGVPRLERLFRRAAGIDVDKMDLRRYWDFVNGKLHDLLVVGEKAARLNGRKAIEPFHLPITKGLENCIREFRQLDEEVELDPIIDQLAARPPLDLPYGEDLEALFPVIVGGSSVALARSFTGSDRCRLSICCCSGRAFTGQGAVVFSASASRFCRE